MDVRMDFRLGTRHYPFRMYVFVLCCQSFGNGWIALLQLDAVISRTELPVHLNANGTWRMETERICNRVSRLTQSANA
jgi:hypothetical protein